GYEVIETGMPALLTIIKEVNEARYPTLQGIDDAYGKKEVKTWKAADIGADENKIGLKASPTMVKKVFSPSAKGQGLILQGSIKEMAHDLVERLKEREIIQKF
ncbi:MAG: Electron transfer flavoprotein beta-subunit, partial [Candidatus Nomurabacteria bacterium GW2011_GWA2_40_9]